MTKSSFLVTPKSISDFGVARKFDFVVALAMIVNNLLEKNKKQKKICVKVILKIVHLNIPCKNTNVFC